MTGDTPQRVLVRGAAMLLLATAADLAGLGSWTLVHALLLVAVVVLVPLALPPLLRAPTSGRRLLLATGPFAVLGVLAPAGSALATVAVLPWCAAAGVLLAREATPLLRAGRLPVPAALPAPAATGFLLVGAVWLLADRSGIAPLGFAPPFTALTAVHFHHAGAVLTAVTTRTARAVGTRAAVAAAALAIVGPPVVGIGFVAAPALQVVGAVLLTAATWTWAAVVLRTPPDPRGRAPALARTAALAVIVPMGLAVWWAIGAATGLPAPSVPTMAATHGVLNGLVFGPCAVLALAGVPAGGLPTPARGTRALA